MAAKIDLQKRILLPLTISLSLLLGLSAFIVIQAVRSLKSDQILSESSAVIEKSAAEIETFMGTRARIPKTLFLSPFIQDWFRKYQQFRRPVNGDEGYSHLISYFNQIMASDPTIKSVFFATENTQEYFDEEGRYEEDGYFVKDRPWWSETLIRDRLYCDVSGADYDDLSRSATFQMPVKTKDGDLLGVGGVDISIGTIEEVLKDVRYQGLGEPFLIDEGGHIIYFPETGLDLTWEKTLSQLEGQIEDAEGLDRLGEMMLEQGEGHTELVWRGIDQMVFFTNVDVPEADLHWQLGLLIPQNVLSRPLARMTLAATMITLLILTLIVGSTLWMMLRTVRPLNLLSKKLDQITHEECDLTVELEVKSLDAIGQTATNFNALMTQLRTLLRTVIKNSADVSASSSDLKEQSESMALEAQQMTSISSQMTHVSRRMLQTLEAIGKSVERVAAMAKQSNEQVTQSEKSVNERVEHMEDMTQKLHDVYLSMDDLKEKSNNIRDAVRIIDDISEQIGLLSINASIEAVKAGEFGKGFAVVAEEIQQMSRHTQKANQQTTAMLKDFQEGFNQFQHAISDVNEQMTGEIGAFQVMGMTFQGLLQDIFKTDAAASRMQEQAQSQMEALHEINEIMNQISEAGQKISMSIATSVKMIGIVDTRVKELTTSTEVFKVEKDEEENV